MATAELVVPNEKKELTALMRLDPGALMAKAIESGADIAVIERFVALAKDVHAEIARQAWHTAVVSFQAEVGPIYKEREAQIRLRGGGSYSFDYAPLEDIDEAIKPALGRNGLSYRWRTIEADDAYVKVVCILAHALGHQEDSGEFRVRV